MLTLRDLAKDDYRRVVDYWGDEEERRINNIKALKYIEGLASKTQTDVSDWDIGVLFAKDSDYEYDYVEGKGEINEIFFSHKDKLAKGVEGFSEEIKARVNRDIQAMGGDLAYLERELKVNEGERDRWYRTMVQYAQKTAECQWAIDRIKNGTNPNLVENLDKALRAQTFFRFRAVQGREIVLHTVADTILTHKNPAQGIDTRLNVGTFNVNFSISGLVPSVHPRANNIFTGERGYYHPHVANNGHICFGEAAARAFKAQVEGDFTTLLTLIAHIISHYSPEGMPYVPLQRLAIGHREGEAPPANQPVNAPVDFNIVYEPQGRAPVVTAEELTRRAQQHREELERMREQLFNNQGQRPHQIVVPRRQNIAQRNAQWQLVNAVAPDTPVRNDMDAILQMANEVLEEMDQGDDQ